ncbi:MAG: GIY-YIG nuclease family protein [Candidatus Levybacteria bacterium]|nr:GIY-YIG nuclease family protein [Candidatus Levybacteria bacterium]
MFYTYILKNHVTSRYYIGYSPNLKNRLIKHKSGKVLSTKSNLNYELEWYCAFKTKDKALAFEKYLKTGSGIAFMKKRFFKFNVALEKVKESSPATQSYPCGSQV